MNVHLVSLGCDKNRVDSEKVLYDLKSKKFNLVSSAELAEAIIINTCAFIDEAKEETIQAILESLEYPNLKKIVVIGCFAQRYYKTLSKEFPNIDIIGIDQYEKISDVLLNDSRQILVRNRRLFDFSKSLSFNKNNCGRILSTPPHYAYLKIADGCNNFCSYCSIPLMRGKYRSFKIEDLLSEAQWLQDMGVKELIVVAQDITRYGYDLYGSFKLINLLEQLSKLNFWKIRLLYAYPELVSIDLINFIVQNDKIAKYIDMPLQHVSDEVLAKMNRKLNAAEIEDKINQLQDNNIIVRSSFITGFPGETQKDFNELCDFISKGRIDHAGFFAYSREEGTRAYSFKPQVPAKEKNRRLEILYEIQEKNVLSKNTSWIGKKIDVIIDEYDELTNCYFARSQYCAPEIDTNVILKDTKKLELGDVINVTISSSGFDLHAFNA